MAEQLLEIKDLHAGVEDKEILKGLSLSVGKGEVHVILGPNGSGKSTLMNIIMGHPKYTVTSGSMTFEGEDMTEMKTFERSRKGLFLSFQTPEEIPGITVENMLRTAKQAITGEKVKLLPFRKELKATGSLKYNPDAKAKYRDEVADLENQLNRAEQNRPKERMAQLLTGSAMKARRAEYPDMKEAEAKKLNQQLLTKYRAQVGAKRSPVEISDRQWEAIQSGAITDSKLKSILDHADIDKIKERATPRAKSGPTPAQISTIKAMAAAGYTNAEIAERFNLSTSTVSKYL